VTDHAGWDEGTLNQWKLQLYGQGDFSAPTAIDDLQATLSADQLGLSWSPASDDVGVSHYVIYRNMDPAFQAQGSDSIGWTDQTSFVDPDSPIKSTTINGYYIVKAVDTSGNKANSSNRVGEFDRALEGGSSNTRHRKVWLFDRG
jgi:hypothetical protein